MNGMAIGNNLGISNFNQLLSVTIFTTLVFIFLYKFIIIYDLTIVPIIVSLMLSTKFLILSTTAAYPSVLLGNVLASVLVIFLGYYFRRYLTSLGR